MQILPQLRRRLRRPSPAALPDPSALPVGQCRNCAATIGEPAPAFCPHCGQATHIKPPTLGEFIQQFGGAYIATEGALWRTLRLLVLRPGELTRLYLAGRRKHYVLPLRLYLTISLVVLLAVRAASLFGGEAITITPDQPATTKQPAPAVKNLRIDLAGAGVGAGMRDGSFYCNNLPAWLCKRLQSRVDLEPQAMAAAMDRAKDRFFANLGGAMFVMLPAFALWLQLVYLNRRMRYTEHLVFALHTHAFWFCALGLTMILTDVLALALPALAIGLPWHTMRALRRVYGGRLWPRLLRVAVASLLYGATLGLALAGVAMWSLLA